MERDDAISPPVSPIVTPSDLDSSRLRSQRLLLLVVRLLFLVLLVSISMLTIAGRQSGPLEFRLQTFLGVLLASAAVGTIVIVLDVMTPNKRLSSVVGVYLGICFGLLAAVAVSFLIDVVANAMGGIESTTSIYLGVSKATLALVFCYLSVSVVLTTKDDFRVVLPYVEFARQVRGIRPLLVDTSSLVDGRIEDVGRAGFIDAPILIAEFVLEELQRLSDSNDRQKRLRGRRGLDVVTNMQQNPFLDVAIDGTRPPGVGVDAMLVEMARGQDLRILTSDLNLRKVAEINGVTVLNINDIARSLRPASLPGESMEIELVKAGEEPSQAVGYLPDGSMVVVQDGGGRVGDIVEAVITNSLQTAGGRMIFAKLADGDATGPADGTARPDPGNPASSGSIGRAATSQPKATGRGPKEGGGNSSERGRSPRRKSRRD
ncbi:MAG: hypothetical protein CMJ22_09160 [Phycisphaerae bacterium]|nr:hypothetical protein [Phycisphaerae bacterium]MDG1360803.1 hypothetical protein [Phycisphaerales bacterium]MDG1977306.1 hypothetical protein [Phycisphaerales bacterium]MDG2132724.1 hypothetical protein [Phycisphaerales bacterium]